MNTIIISFLIIALILLALACRRYCQAYLLSREECRGLQFGEYGIMHLGQRIAKGEFQLASARSALKRAQTECERLTLHVKGLELIIEGRSPVKNHAPERPRSNPSTTEDARAISPRPAASALLSTKRRPRPSPRGDSAQ